MFASSMKDLGCCNYTVHSIDTQGSEPIREPPRRVPFHMKEEIKKQLDELLEAGIIEPSNSEWATALVPIKKKTGGISYPITRLDETTDKFFGIEVFTTLDMASGYYQVKMDPKDKEKTAMATSFGLYHFVRMPFGLTNAPATFQRMVDKALTGLIGKICLVYLDDIIVYSRTVEQHIEHLKLIFDRLRQAALKFNRKKCFFMKRQVIYLGHVVNSDGLFPCEDKVKAIKAFKIPRTIKQLQNFLGLKGYYRKFIRDYSKIASPLFKATKKGKKFEFDKRCEDAFNKLKDCLTSTDLLIFPKFHDTFRLETDASDIGLGAVLSQKRDGEWKPIAFWSRQLMKSEQITPQGKKKR
ncbi:unnamed protein product [Brachionus calyciflorus]|uniref:Reverse transcriptase domain-containing protein n=1 Tax=Brachionus calyciflorus TaxID=104777 RepID=A0A813YNC8_9BILA|nr:unnamed protein product [Brachionus calyciflorus]